MAHQPAPTADQIERLARDLVEAAPAAASPAVVAPSAPTREDAAFEARVRAEVEALKEREHRETECMREIGEAIKAISAKWNCGVRLTVAQPTLTVTAHAPKK